MVHSPNNSDELHPNGRARSISERVVTRLKELGNRSFGAEATAPGVVMDPGGLAQAVEVEFNTVAEPHHVGGVVGNCVAGLGVQQNCQVASVEREPGNEACKEVSFEGDLIAPAWVWSDRLVVPASENGVELRIDSGAQGFSIGLGLGVIIDMGVVAGNFGGSVLHREKLVPCGRPSTILRANSAKFSRTAVDGPRTGLVYLRRLLRVAFGPGVFRSVNVAR